jgi:hypothetical protein
MANPSLKNRHPLLYIILIIVAILVAIWGELHAYVVTELKMMAGSIASANGARTLY